MFTQYVGSGGCGDTVILSTKLLNIIYDVHSIDDQIHYKHFESDKRKAYESTLHQYWSLVQKAVMNHMKNFEFSIQFYPHGKFWDVVPRAVFNTATGLTTQVDALCSLMPLEIVDGNCRYYDRICIVADGGNHTRGLTDNAIKQLRDAFPRSDFVLIGTRQRELTLGRVENLTACTTVADALSIARSSELVVGPDGMLTYFAAIYEVPTVIIFHEPPLINAYAIHKLPYKKVKIINHGGYLNEASQLVRAAKSLLT